MELETTTHMRIAEAFLPTFNRKTNPLTRKGFVSYAKDIEESSGRAHQRQWPALKAGHPVPTYIVRDFIDYLKLLEPDAHDLDNIAVACPPPQPASAGPKIHRNAWRVGWRFWGAFLDEKFVPPANAYCRDFRDLAEAATMVLESVGARGNRTLTPKAALEAGQKITGRSVDDYTQLLSTFWRANKHSVLFATQLDGHTSTRTGVSVLVPLAESCYRRFREGKAEDLDVTAADLLPTSPYILINAAADNRCLDMRSKFDWNVRQFLTLIYQISTLCPCLLDGPHAPHLIGFAGNEESRQRLEAYNFRRLKAKTPRTGKMIMVMERPLTFDFKSMLIHTAAMALIQAFQAGTRAAKD